jgi:hypothetical protein
MRWRAWYPDRVFGSEDVAWTDLPAEGLQVVVVYLPNPGAGPAWLRQMYAGGDWYWLTGGEIHYAASAAEMGTWREPPTPAELPCRSCLKRGSMLSDADFRAIVTEAMA